MIDSVLGGVQYCNVDRRNVKCWKIVKVADAKLSEASTTLVEIGFETIVPPVFDVMTFIEAVNLTTCSEEFFLGCVFHTLLIILNK